MALSHLFLLIKSHHPCILILVETCVDSSYVDRIVAKSNMTHSMVAEAQGFSKGIWILWNSNCIQIKPVAIDNQIITVVVCNNKSKLWLLSTIYASPIPAKRQRLREYLIQLGRLVNFPWLETEDFNQVTHASEKNGG